MRFGLIGQALATDPDKVTALGFPDERVQYVHIFKRLPEGCYAHDPTRALSIVRQSDFPLFTMHIRTHIAITALAVPIFLAACSPEAHTQGSYSAASLETETPTAPDCPEHDSAASELPLQQELARDIRTILTGEKSPVQQEALVQAASIAPGQMSDALREVLVDAAAFVAYLPGRDRTGDTRLDSLTHLLVCALQPHFSQEELAADILSIISFDEQGHYLPGNRARQTTAAWLAIHIPPGEMGEELQRAVIRGMLSISSDNYPMYTAWYLLSEALLKQRAEYSDADLAAEIRTIQAGEKDIYAPLAAIHAAGRWGNPGFGYVSDPENIGPESRVAMIETLTYLNEKVNERDWLLERLEAVGDEEGKKAPEISHQDQGRSRVLHRMLAHAVSSLETPEAIEALVNAGELHLSFIHFGNRSVVPIVDVLSGERLYTGQAMARLASLTDIVRSSKWERIEPLSPDNRDLIVRTARRLLGREGLKDFQGLPVRGVLSSAVYLALELDEPDLIHVVETLASNREEVIARGVPHAEVEYFQQDIKETQQARQRSKEILDTFREPELPQDELVAAIRAIMEGEEGDAQFKAPLQVSRMEPERIGDSLRATLIKIFLYKYEAAMQQKQAGADFDLYTGNYEVIMLRLGEAISQLRDPSLIKFFVHLGQYGICGNEAGGFENPNGIFRRFPDTSAVLLAEAISTPTTSLKKMYDGLALLSELAVSHKMGRLHFSHESRALLIATGRHFPEGGFLSSLPMQDTTGVYPFSRSHVLREAIVFAVALDAPDLIEIVEALATDPDKVTALGVPDEEVKDIQETARRLLRARPYEGIFDC